MSQIHPEKIPTQKEEIRKHQSKPNLVRDYVLNLPDGYSLFYFCSVVLDYKDLDPIVHGALCHFLEHTDYGRFRDATVPRSWFKTSVATVGKALWLPIKRDPNITILIAMNTSDNAEKRVNLIRHHWENNILLKSAFPELVPDFRKIRWSNACAELRRTRPSDEGTYESVGSGGAVVSRHYDHIIEDDLVYAKKDDLTGAEIQPNREDIEKAIGWHKLVYSLFSDPAKSTLDNIGTRWAVHDFKDWIRKKESRKYKFFQVNARNAKGEPVWPSRFPEAVLKELEASQGPYMFATQYMNQPRDPADAAFSLDKLNYINSISDIPQHSRWITIVDLALWGDSKGLARNVICTMAMDRDHNLYVAHYDRGKFDPDEVILRMEAHHRQFPDTTVWVEEVQYQRAIRYFAHKRMRETGYRYSLEPLPPDHRKDAKDLRIRNLVNQSKSGGFFVKHSQTDLIEEYCDYPSGLTKDILDCIGWALRMLRPGTPSGPKPPEEQFKLETVINEIKAKAKTTKYPFNVQLGNVDHALKL